MRHTLTLLSEPTTAALPRFRCTLFACLVACVTGTYTRVDPAGAESDASESVSSVVLKVPLTLFNNVYKSVTSVLRSVVLLLLLPPLLSVASSVSNCTK